ncbi:MAG TPA: G8 domain-containing protein [Thermoanaerobaculia bacterium]|nr:G8 domain-containing protein [Thermoanaerobaculia bacterium]
MKSLRFFAAVVVFSLATIAAGLDWPTIPPLPSGLMFKAAASGGDWNTPSTWEQNVVPADNAVVTIPPNANVTLSGNTNSLLWVEVDGNLSLSSTTSSQLTVETLRIARGGTFTLNSLGQGLTAKVIFTSSGKINTSWDPQQITRGMIAEGKVTIAGLAKTYMVTVSADIPKHTTAITLDAVPSNWQPNDDVVITGTHFRRYSPMQDERRTIVSISPDGKTITLDRGLDYDHQRVSTTNSLSQAITPPLHVANLTRNVIFTSAKTANTFDRGHVIIGNEDSSIQSVAFVNLGRTDKSKILNDYKIIPPTGTPTSLVPQGSADITNMRGRYPLHVFMTFKTRNPPSEAFPRQTVINDCVVDGSIGWGFVNRSSNVDFRRNVAYNFLGAGFVAEGGDETGNFIRNIAIHGVGQIWADVTDPQYRGTNIYKKRRLNFGNPTRPQPLEDIAFNGEGFWFSGPALTVNQNVANSCHGAGMIWQTTGIVDVSTVSAKAPFGLYTYFPQAWMSSVYPGLSPSFGRRWDDGTDEVLTSDLPIIACSFIDSYANFIGFRLRFVNFDNTAWYGETPFNYQSHILGTAPAFQRQTISNLNLWNDEAAMTLSYAGVTDWSDVSGISRLDYDEKPPYPDPGIDPNYGIESNLAVTDMTWTRLTLDGYELGTWTSDGTNTANFPVPQSTFHHYAANGPWTTGHTYASPGKPAGSADGTITWAPPQGTTPTRYLVRYRPVGNQQWSFDAPTNMQAPSVRIPNIVAGQMYQVQVDAGYDNPTNAALNGLSPWVTGKPFPAQCAPAGIAMQPADTGAPSGQPAMLAVEASGDGPFTYQWYEGAAPSTDIPIGSNSSTLSIAPPSTTSYWVNVTNACGDVSSSSATVNVCSPPAITAQPQSQTVTAGSSAILSTTAGGAGLSYQWYQGEAPSVAAPAGTNSSTLSVTPAAMTSYWVSVTNGCGSTASDTAIVSVCYPPSVAVQPLSQTVPAGSAVTLSVAAYGTSPFTYQWYQGTAPSIASPIGTNSSTLTIAPASTTSYWVSITNGCGSVASNTVTVTLCNPPTITVQPQSQTIAAGSSATLSVSACCDASFSYQWYSGVTPVGNGSTLNVSPAVTTTYWVSVSNSCGSTASNIATVTVCGPVTIATQPLSQTVGSGSSATLTVAASGGGSYSYQWYDGTSGNVATPVGTNSSTFVTPPLTAMKSYWVRVTSSCLGTFTADSATATISVQIQIVRRQLAGNNANSMPSLTTNWSQPTQAGSLLVAVISASDVAQIGAFTPPAGWQLANTNSYTNIKTSIYYYPNNPGGRTAETFSLTNYPDSTLDLIEYTGVMAASPLDQTAIDEGSAPIGMVAVDTGTTQPTAKPREVVLTALTMYAQTSFTTPTNSFVKIDEQSVLYHLTTAVHESLVTTTGSYGHQANVGGNAQWVGLAVTFMAIECTGPPAISAQPASTTNPAGQPATLTVTAAGSGLNYQWYQGTAPSTMTPVGTNSSTLTVTPAATTSYWVNVSSACGSTASNTATITLCTLPGIAVQPLSQSSTSGASVTLSVTASGNAPFSYQWYQGTAGTITSPIGTNSSTITVNPTVTTSYWVKVSNSCGATNSNTATVTICSPAVIVTQPSSQTIPAGSPATLSVAAGGSTPFTVQWYQGTSGTTTTPVGTNSSTFTVTPAATTSYWVKVTNSCGAASSNTATITVLTHITRRQRAAGNANSMSSLTANWTQATQAGSLLVGIISASDSNAIGAFTPPAGWQLANTYSFNNVKTSIYYYPNNPGGRTAETFSLTNYPDSTLDLIEYTGVMAASPLDKTGFDGGWSPVNGIVDSGSTPATAQSKEVVITALTTYAQTSFTNATNGFTKLDEQGVLSHLTTAIHENIVTTAGGWGHSANAGGSAPWVGLVVTFKSADTSP